MNLGVCLTVRQLCFLMDVSSLHTDCLNNCIKYIWLVFPKTMGRRQVVRHRILVPAFGGSNPPAPANCIEEE